MTQSEYNVFYEKIARIKELETEISALKAEIQRLKEWHPIAEAPKDGNPFLMMTKYGARVVIPFNGNPSFNWIVVGTTNNWYSNDECLGWMPLPVFFT